MNKKLLDKYWDEFLSAYYHQSCGGCPEGHNSFWQTIIESEEWQKWKEKNKDWNWDFTECEELGLLSQEHFKAFISFCKKL